MQLHDETPTDDDGLPVHPEDGYHICGRGRNRPEFYDARYPFCLNPAGFKTDRATEPGAACKYHGGASSGAPEGHGNSVKHNLNSNISLLYDRLDDTLQAEVDAMEQDWLDQLAEIKGRENITHGEETRIFRIAVETIKEFLAENYMVERSLEDGTGNPLINTEVVGSGEQGAVTDDVPSRIGNRIDKISRRNRQWLKEHGLLDASPDDRQATTEDEIKSAMLDDLRSAHGE